MKLKKSSLSQLHLTHVGPNRQTRLHVSSRWRRGLAKARPPGALPATAGVRLPWAPAPGVWLSGTGPPGTGLPLHWTKAAGDASTRGAAAGDGATGDACRCRGRGLPLQGAKPSGTRLPATESSSAGRARWRPPGAAEDERPRAAAGGACERELPRPPWHGASTAAAGRNWGAARVAAGPRGHSARMLSGGLAAAGATSRARAHWGLASGARPPG